MNLEWNERTSAPEQVIGQSGSVFGSFFERSADAIWLYELHADQTVVLVDCNQAVVELMGAANKEQVLRTRTEDLSPPIQPDGSKSSDKAAEVIAVVQREKTYRFEWMIRRMDGREVPVEVSATAVHMDGKSMHVYMSRDISERKIAERNLVELTQALERRVIERTAALTASEARFSAAFNASPAFLGILAMSDGKYVLANDAFLNWLEYPREEVINRTCFELGMWDDPAERDFVIRDIQTFGSIRQRECRWRNRRGKLFTVLISAETITLNNTPHILSMALDITQRKRAEEELVKTLEREKELSELKSNFVSMVSHEFRTPLGIIQSSSELLRDYYERMQPTEREEQLGSIIRNTRRMADMMEEVLVLSRLDAGKLVFQPAPIDLNCFCRRVVDEVLSATNNRCQIELSLTSVPGKARADERLLGHIFTNLLSNAVKYSEPEETVHFTVRQENREAVCVVQDKGIGISDNDQPLLFKAFHRGSNVGSRPGTGLGLLLVKRCADLHGGTVHLKSKIGRGTTVTVRLPVLPSNYEKDISDRR